MERINLKDCCFHDWRINDIDYNGEILTLYMPCNEYKGVDGDYCIEIKVDEYDINVYYQKQYPRFSKVKLKGKEIKISNLKSIFKKGYTLEIHETMAGTDSNFLIFECELFPYAPGRGVYRKIFLYVYVESGYLTLKEIKK